MSTRRTKFDEARARADRRGDWTPVTDEPTTLRRARYVRARIRRGEGRWAPAGTWEAEARPTSDARTAWLVHIRPAWARRTDEQRRVVETVVTRGGVL